LITDELRSTNWDLEVSLRDIQSTLSDSQSTIHRLESDTKRLTKQLSSARDASDNSKTEFEKLQTNIEELKSKHEFEIAQARRHAAGLARDKSDLQQMVDTLKAEAVAVARRRGAGRFGESLLTPGHGEQRDFLTPGGDGDGEDVFGTTGRGSTNRRNNHLDMASLFPPDDLGDFDNLSPDVSPLRNDTTKPLFLAPNHPSNEIEALQQRLAHAQRQIGTLKGSLMREKQARMRAEGVTPNGADFDEEEGEEGEEYADEDTAGAENKKTKKMLTPFRVGRGRGRGRGVTLIQRLTAAIQNDDEDEEGTHLYGSQHQQHPVGGEEEDEVSQFFGSTSERSRETADAERELETPEKERELRSPSPTAPVSNRTSVDGMDPAYANVLRRVPSTGSNYAGSPLRQSILGRSVGRGRRPRGGVPFKDATRPRSIVDDNVPGVLASELLGGGVEGGEGEALRDMEGPGQMSLLHEGIIEEGEDGEEYEYVRVKKVEKVEFGCQTEVVEVPVAHVSPSTPAAPAVELVDMGTQSELEPAPAPVVEKPTPSTLDMGLQTLAVLKSEAATQCDTEVGAGVATKLKPLSPVRVSSGVGTDPSPVPRGVGIGLPPIVTAIDEYQNRRATITQADISKTSSKGDTTVTRSFLVERHDDDDDIDEGEETETGADDDATEDEYDYLDARQSIQLSTPSEMEDYHSMITMTENYSDEEDDAESIKASQFSIRDNMSMASFENLNRPETSTSYHSMLHQHPAVMYESVGVGADLYFPPQPLVIEREVPVPVVVAPPKPEVKEMSVQTDEWKPPSTVVPAPPRSPTLVRVGSGTHHQFQFIPPPPQSAGFNGSVPASVFTPPVTAPATSPLSSIFREPSLTSANGSLGRRITASDRRQSIDSIISSGTGPGPVDEPVRSRVPSSATTSILLNSSDKSKPPMVSLPPPPRLPPPPSTIMPPPNFIPDRRSDGPPPRPTSPPPPELIQRATTPLGSVLSMHGAGGKVVRIHGSSMPPSQTGIRQPPSTSSFRSAAGANTVGGSSHPSFLASTLSYNGKEKERDRDRRDRDRSTISLASDVGSPRSSISSEQHILPYDRSRGPSTPSNKSADITPRAINNPNATNTNLTITNGSQGQSTDPVIIHAITQTMIGEFMWKYTRKTIGKGVGERRHKRFFWVHPYTKTLYWSSADPGSSNASESSAKSGMFFFSNPNFFSVCSLIRRFLVAYIEGVRSVLDPNPMPPGLYQYSVVVSTPHREMKITAPTKDRHDIWLNVNSFSNPLHYLC